MKTLLLIPIITSILFVPFILEESWQASENLFYGSSSFEKLPSVISDEPATFELKMQYTEGPFTITKLAPIFDVSPKGVKQYVQIKTKPIDGLYRNDVVRIQGNMTIDPQAPYKKIFISVYFNGTDGYGNPYKSAWTDSVTLNIEQGGSIDVAQKCKENTLGAKYGKPVDLEYEIDGGTVISNCNLEDQNSVITKIDAEKDGQITIKIPKKIVYSISGKNCEEDADLIILMDGEEALPVGVINNKKDNIVTVEFPKGIHTIEVIGTSIIPDPAPSQYCGVVMGFDSLYLPPKFQIEKGMKIEQVKCNKDLTLLKKASNGLPICVSLETGQKLLERKFAQPTIFGLTSESALSPNNTNQREITTLSITPQNVTLPEPKNQTHETKCNEDGVCFTPE